MAWHDDKQRREDAAQARALKEQKDAVRMKTARRAYESGLTMKAICSLARTNIDTLKKWIEVGGWKRDEA